MSGALSGLSSMATKHVLADLSRDYAQKTGQRVSVTSMGGVDAAARVRAGEQCDFVVLAADAIARLEAEGLIAPGSRTDVARSGIAVAVVAGAHAPDISSEGAVRDAVMKAKAIAFSTGPSGSHLARLFEKWGIAESVKPRLKQAPVGIPVGALLARGEADLGFQQLSELIHLDGIRVVGPLPPDIQAMTTFSAGVCATSAHRDGARALLQFLSSSVTDECKRQHGMEPCP
jgi:molybdate transport system substrate-binding protein